MCQLVYLMVSFDIHGKISPVIVGDSEFIPVGICQTFTSFVHIFTNRDSYWPARAVREIH